MKKLNLFIVLFIALSAIFTACNKDKDIIKPVPNPPVLTKDNVISRNMNNGNPDGLEIECILVKFPFQVFDNQDVTISIESEQDLDDIFNKMQTDSNYYVIDFIYPISVLKADGTEIEVVTSDALFNLIFDCFPGGGWSTPGTYAFTINWDNSCYKLLYPVTVKDDDGALVTANDEAELVSLLALKPYYFVYPLSLKHKDGFTDIANSENELLDYLISCVDVPCDSFKLNVIGCFKIVFPVELEKVNGDVITVTNYDEYVANFLSGEILGYHYPIVVQHIIDGTEYVVNSEDELNTLVAGCETTIVPSIEGAMLYSGAVSDSSKICYTIDFPISFTLKGGTIKIVSSLDELLNLINQPIEATLNYPVIVTGISDGKKYTFNNLNDNIEFITNCQ